MVILHWKKEQSCNNYMYLLFQVQIYKEPYIVSFIDKTSRAFYKPGLPYVGHVSISIYQS